MIDLAESITKALAEITEPYYFRANAGGSICDSINVRFALEKKEQWHNGIWENATSTQFHIWNVDSSGRVLQHTHTGLYKVDLLTFDYRFRKAGVPKIRGIRGNAAKIEKHVVEYFTKLIQLMKAEATI